MPGSWRAAGRRAAAARSSSRRRISGWRLWLSPRPEPGDAKPPMTAPAPRPHTNQIGASASAFRAADRIASIAVSEILRIGATAAALRRQGRPVIVLGAGEPDFDTPAHVGDAAIRAIHGGKTKYTILDGTPQLKAAILEKFRLA